MDRRVIWTEPALDDLTAAAEFLGRDSPRYAAAFVRGARAASRSLVRMSERGRYVPEVNEPDVRELFVGQHRLIYEIVADQVYPRARAHGARSRSIVEP